MAASIKQFQTVIDGYIFDVFYYSGSNNKWPPGWYCRRRVDGNVTEVYPASYIAKEAARHLPPPKE